MKVHSLLTTFLCIICFLCSCKKEKITSDPKLLADKLEAIALEDQKYRQHLGEIKEKHGINSPKMAELLTNQSKVDSSNLKTVINIIKELGAYPGKSRVGIKASKSAFHVLQHAPIEIRKNYLDMILDAASKNELSKRNAAMFHDKCLMDQNQPQVYGTQIKFETLTNSEGLTYDTSYVWTIQDTVGIDLLRHENGLNKLEEYLHGYGKSRWK